MPDEIIETSPEEKGTEIGNASTETQNTEVIVSKPAEVEAKTPELPSYTPNFKYKVNDKDQEFDEFIRSSIKDKESEEKVRKLYADAYGLEAIKPKYDDLKAKYPVAEQNYQQLNDTINEVLDLKDKDLGAFFDRLKLPEEKVAQWMLDKIKKMELPPEQQQVYNQYEETRRRNLTLEKQFQQLEARTQAQEIHARILELDTSLQRPEVSSFMKAFDDARKAPGAFKEEVRERGIYEWKVNGKDISVADAIAAVMSRYTGMVNPTEMGTQHSQQPGQEKPLPVIPRVQGKAVSFVGKQPRSIADLKKISAELSG